MSGKNKLNKREKIMILAIVILIGIATTQTSKAFIGIVASLLSSFSPKPTYSVFQGLEVDKLEKAIETVILLNELYAQADKGNTQNLTALKATAATLGNKEFLSFIDDPEFDWSEISQDKWNQMFRTNINTIFGDKTGEYVLKDINANMDNNQTRRVQTLIRGMSGEQVKGFERQERRVYETYQMHKDYYERLMAEVSGYGIDPATGDLVTNQRIENSTPVYLEITQNQLNDIIKRMDEAKALEAQGKEASTPIAEQKITNQLLIMLMQNELKQTELLRLMCEGVLVDGVTDIKTKVEKVHKDVAHGYNWEDKR